MTRPLPTFAALSPADDWFALAVDFDVQRGVFGDDLWHVPLRIPFSARERRDRPRPLRGSRRPTARG